MKDIILIILIVVYVLFVFFIIYHLIRFGIGVKPKITALFFFFGSLLILILLIWTWSQINWDEILKLIKTYFQF